MKEVVIFGTGQTSEIVSYYLNKETDFKIVAYTIDSKEISEEKFNKKPVVAFEHLKEEYPPSKFNIFIAVGYRDLNKLREKKFLEAKSKGYSCISFIHPRAGNFDPKIIGENSFIMEHQSIQPFSKIGNNCFIWSGVLIAHHSVIKDHCWITSESSIAGNTTVGERCFLGINSTIGHMVNIGKDNFIGAGTLITKSTKDGSVFITSDTDVYKLNSEQFLKITQMK